MWWNEAWEPLGDLAEWNPKCPNRAFCSYRLLCEVGVFSRLFDKKNIYLYYIRYHDGIEFFISLNQFKTHLIRSEAFSQVESSKPSNAPKAI